MPYINNAVLWSVREYEATEHCVTCNKRWKRTEVDAPFARCRECRINLSKTKPKKMKNKRTK